MTTGEGPPVDLSSLVIRDSSFREANGFTIIELIVVLGIVLVLAGLILATGSYVYNKGARSRAEVEIAAISAALENYKADNGAYVSAATIDAQKQGDPASYQASSLLLYQNLTGDFDNNRSTDSGKTSYLSFKPNQLSPSDQSAKVTFIKDPFGNSYGYSTINSTDSTKGYNPTFDLWTTAGTVDTSNSPNSAGWIKNW